MDDNEVQEALSRLKAESEQTRENIAEALRVDNRNQCVADVSHWGMA